MRNNVEDITARRLRQQSSRYGNLTLRLTGLHVVPDDGPTFHYLDPNGADRTVYLPPLTLFGGQHYWIANLAIATNVLNVVDADGAAIGTIIPGAVAILSSNQSRWFIFQTAGANTEPPVTNVTGAAYNISTSDTYIRVNYAGAVVLTLPGAAARNELKLRVKDVSGNASGNSITIVRAGGDLIDGQTSLEILSDWGTWELKPSTGKWDVLP